MRKGFRLEEVRALGVDELGAFLEILYPQRTTGVRAKSLRQDWRKWKRRYGR